MPANLDAENLYNMYFGASSIRGLVAEKRASRYWEKAFGRTSASANATPVPAAPPKEREAWCALRSEIQQFELDAASWYGTLKYSRDADKAAMLKRLFSVLHFAGLVFKRHGAWSYWYSTNMPIATALSHGGRILIQTPVDDDVAPDSLWNWLWGNLSAAANTRAAATHDAKYAKTPERILRNLQKFWIETNPSTGGRQAFIMA